MKIYIMRGPSGSGKSTWVRENVPDAFICSADHYFQYFSLETGEPVYRFDASNLGEAHGACLRAFTEVITRPSMPAPRQPDVVVVDNTNITMLEMAPYVALANAYGHIPTIVGMDAVVELEMLAARNVHRVPLSTIRDQCSRYQYDYPRYWRIDIFSHSK